MSFKQILIIIAVIVISMIGLYYLMSFDLYDDQETNYPELALKFIK